MNRCKTCRHWGEQFSDGSLHHFCKSEKFIYVSAAIPDLSDTLEYWDDDEYKATFTTGPEFGCVHHEAREDDQPC